mgnify:CR=1 FL=1
MISRDVPSYSSRACALRFLEVRKNIKKLKDWEAECRAVTLANAALSKLDGRAKKALKAQVRSRRPVVQRPFHAIDARRLQE